MLLGNILFNGENHGANEKFNRLLVSESKL